MSVTVPYMEHIECIKASHLVVSTPLKNISCAHAGVISNAFLLKPPPAAIYFYQAGKSGKLCLRQGPGIKL